MIAPNARHVHARQPLVRNAANVRRYPEGTDGWEFKDNATGKVKRFGKEE